MDTRSFTTGSISRCLLRFVGPYMLGVILQSLYGAVDLIVVGHFATTADVSAVTIGSQLMNMVTQLIIGFATGITVLVGRGFGARDEKLLSRTVGSSVILFGSLALMLTLGYALAKDAIVGFMQTPPEAIVPTDGYILACTVGIPFIVAYNVISSMLMGLGDTKTPFLFIAVACAVNIVLDLVLVKGFGMGALGAAIATTIAQMSSVLFALLFLKKRGLGFSFCRKDIRFDRPATLHIIKIGAPVAVQNVVVGLSFLFITAIINQMGMVASAAVGVVEKLIGFLMIPPAAFGAAVAAVAAQNIGAGKPERARRTLWTSVAMALIPSLLVVLFVQFFGRTLAAVFSSDAAVIEMAAVYLRSYVTDCLLVSLVFPMNGYFNSVGYSWFTLAHSLLTTALLRVPLSYVFSRMAGATLFTVGWAAPLSTLASVVLCAGFLWWMRGQREQKRREKTVGMEYEHQS